MSELHRIKIKKGEIEIEIESTEKEYLNSKLNELLEHHFVIEKSKATSPQHKTPKPNKLKNSKSAKSNKNLDDNEPQLDISGLLNYIKEQDDYPFIEKNILDKKDQLPKILTCFYYAEKYFDSPYLTTGNIETITDQFGAKIKTPNVSAKVKGNQKYFSQDQVRKKGALLKYKLNRAGVKEFEKYLQTIEGK